MPPELTALALSALLQAAQFAHFALRANIELGAKYTTSPRDQPPQNPLSKSTARLQRAMNNHFESLILFTIAVIVVTLGNQSTPLTQTAAYLYLAARLLYVPAYALGLAPWRSLIWSIGFTATMAIILAALL